ncbi:hypothetical protein KIH87_02555 [Paraneptunicella aestuarii]|nr:DUF6702 family protein [Paraneptunicella aestuarii]UAA40685.1 hypothetical protein KIH87_02555 [Paraneptunicella aestuarii]
MVCLHTFFSTNVYAHQQKAAITKVLFNQHSKNLEVMHRFILHDAEHAVRHIFGKNADIISDKATQETFAKYVTEHFSINAIPQGELPLKLVGHEIEGQFFWVYQETAIPQEVTALSISHKALHDVWTKQVNQVNVEGKGTVKSLIFRDDSQSQTVTFETLGATESNPPSPSIETKKD